MSAINAAQDKIAQLHYRIQCDIDAFEGKLPERYSIAWGAYLAALVEWRIIDLEAHERLLSLLPKVSEPDPVESILLGRD
jgi:hypothetical protein